MHAQRPLNQSIPGTSELLRAELVRRIDRNPRYTRSAFARDLGMSSSFLSEILSGKKRLPLKRALLVSNALDLDEETARLFLSSVISGAGGTLSFDLAQLPNFTEIEQREVLERWYPIAILELIETSGFKSSARWIAARLALSVAQVEDSIKRLERLGLIKKERGQWKKIHERINFRTLPSRQLRRYHKKLIQNAIDHIDRASDHDFDLRDMSGSTFAANPTRVKQAKRRIEKFRKEMIEFLGNGKNRTEVFQLNIQLFQVSKRSTK